MNFTPGAIQDIMQRQFERLRRLDATAAPTVEALFPFRAEDVYAVHFRKQDAGDGVWFRLYDSRVFDACGRPADSDPALYDMKPH